MVSIVNLCLYIFQIIICFIFLLPFFPINHPFQTPVLFQIFVSISLVFNIYISLFLLLCVCVCVPKYGSPITPVHMSFESILSVLHSVQKLIGILSIFEHYSYCSWLLGCLKYQCGGLTYPPPSMLAYLLVSLFFF